MNYYLKRRILFLAFLSFCVILQAQREEKRISGHVRDAQDLPLAGVNIKVKIRLMELFPMKRESMC